MFSPLAILGMWARGFLAVAILGGSVYALYRWHDGLPRSEIVTVDPQSGAPTETRELHGFRERISAWRPAWDIHTGLLAGAVALMSMAFLGRRIYPRALRPTGINEPNKNLVGETFSLPRPDGTILNVECMGPPAAPRLIMTHGWGCDHHEWYYVKQHFSNRYRVITWDLPGLGQSTEPENRDYSLEKMAADLRAVLEATGNQPAILVGHSIGGMTSLTFCRQFPEFLGDPVVGIALAHTTYTNPLKTMFLSSVLVPLQKPIIEPLLWVTIALSPVVWIMNWLSYWNGSSHRSAERQSFAGRETRGQLDFAAHYTIEVSPAVIARGGLGMLRYDVTNTLADIPIPVLVVVGDLDPITKPEAGEHIGRTIPHARIRRLAPAKHLGLFEQYATFNQYLEQFALEVFTPGRSQVTPMAQTR